MIPEADVDRSGTRVSQREGFGFRAKWVESLVPADIA